ncbi:OB-fold nucleic acid binding domain-containing protein [Lactococcus lactis]
MVPIGSLYRSNDIYLPEWRTRYICYDNGGSLTSVLFAIGQAEGFVPTNIFSKIKSFFSRDYDPRTENRWWKKSDFIKKVHRLEENKRLELLNEAGHDDSYLKKLNDLRENGISPFSLPDSETESVETIRNKFESVDEFDEKEYIIHGKLISLRGRGAMQFADLADNQAKIQLVIKRDTLNEYAELENRLENFAIWKKDVTVGDRVLVKGNLMRTQTGELSLRVNSWKMLSKTLRELTDIEKIGHTKFIERTEYLSRIRRDLLSNRFVEVDKQDYLALAGDMIRSFLFRIQK